MTSPRPSLSRRLLEVALGGLLLVALLLVSAWVALYFAAASSPGRALLGDRFREAAPAGVGLSFVHWGPAPGALLLGGLTLVDEGRPLARVDAASARISLPNLVALLGDGDLVLDLVSIDLAYLHARRDAEGRLDIVTALRQDRTSSPKPPGRGPRLAIDRLVLRCGALTLDGPREDVDVRDLEASLRIDARPLLPRIEASLATRAVHIHTGRETLGFDALLIDQLTLAEATLDLHARLLRSDEDIVNASLDVDLTAPRIDASFSAALAPHDLPLALGRIFPLGLEIADARLTFAKGETSGAIGSLRAPLLDAPPVSAAHLGVEVARIGVEDGTVLPRVALEIRGLQAARLTTPGSSLEGLDFGHGLVSLDKRLDVALLPGHATRWTTSQDLGPTDLALAADLGLTGGPIALRLGTAEGLVDATLDVRVSLLRKRTDLSATVSLASASPRLLAATLPALDGAALATLAWPADATADLDIDPGARGESPTLSWQGATLNGSNGATLTLEDDRWVAPPTSAMRAEVTP